jgi:HEAT repeat protein
MDDLKAQAVHLRSLGELPPTPERRAEVVLARHHKREGIQSVAAQVLGHWGGRESVSVLRDWLVDSFARESGWSVRGVAIRQLASLVESSDAQWVLELYFGVPNRLLKHELFFLVKALPPESARVELVARLRDPDWVNRQAAVKAIGNMAFSDRRRLLTPLIDDSHEQVQKSARYPVQKA